MAAPVRQSHHDASTRLLRMVRLAGVALSLVALLVLIHLAGVIIRANENLDAMVVTPVASSAAGVAPMTMATSSRTPSTRRTAAPALLTGQDILPTSTPTLTSTPTPMPSATPTPLVEEPPPANEALTLLLLGTDRRPDEAPDDYPRTDAMMLVRIDPKQQRIALLSMPRDLWVEIPGYWYNRINTAYQTGETYAPGSGMQLAAQTVSNVFQIRVDYVVMINFQGFIGLIDTIGGVTIDVEKELYDARYPTMDYGYMEAHFLPGPQHMDGQTALIYSRIRHPDSDFMRIQRQQKVMIAIGARLRERGDLQNLLAVDQITGALKDFVRTDMPKERIVNLIWSMRDHEITRVERYKVTTDMVTWGVGNDIYALVPNLPTVRQVAQTFQNGD